MNVAAASSSLEWLARRIGHSFEKPQLLLLACTHRSFGGDNNERLEYLGDALIGFVVAAELYRRRPRVREGALSRLRANLVCEDSLAALAAGLELGEALRLGEGELKSGGFRRPSILADAFEAMIGAVYMDAGFETTRQVCLELFRERLDNLPDVRSLKDAKTRLQEWLQARGESLPLYEVLEESGPPHKRRFSVGCRMQDGAHVQFHTQATASSRRKAEQEAAARALSTLEEDNA